MRPWVGTFLSLGGLSASLTVVYLGMRSVMEIGGACASGGPYEVATPCPEGVPLLMVGGIWGLFIFGGLFAWFVGGLGSNYIGLLGFAWCALFLSLGWNFLEYGVDPPGASDGPVVGWLVCAVLFALMGGLPLLGLAKPSNLRGMLWPADPPPREQRRPSVREVVPVAGMKLTRPPAPARDAVTRATPATRGAAVLDELTRPAAEPRGSSGRSAAAGAAGSSAAGSAAPPAAPPADLAGQLERLARLHHRGDLDDAEYEAAKRAVLGE